MARNQTSSRFRYCDAVSSRDAATLARRQPAGRSAAAVDIAMSQGLKPKKIAGAPEHEAPATGVCTVCGSGRLVPHLEAPDRFHGRTAPHRLVRCQSCSLVRLDRPPAPSEMAEHYGSSYDNAISGPGDDPSHWRERRDALLLFKHGGALLDLGCSSGGFLAAMQGPEWKLFGVEMSEAVAKRARDRCGAEVYVGDILDAPFPPGSFDAITCFHVFEHLCQPTTGAGEDSGMAETWWRLLHDDAEHRFGGSADFRVVLVRS